MKINMTIRKLIAIVLALLLSVSVLPRFSEALTTEIEAEREAVESSRTMLELIERIPDTSDLDFTSFLDYTLEELPEGWTAGDWEPLAHIFSRTLFSETGDEAGEQQALSKDDDMELMSSVYYFSLDSGEKIGVQLASQSDAVILRIEWPEGKYPFTKAVIFDREGRQLGFGIYADEDGESFLYYVEPSEDGSFQTSYMMMHIALPDVTIDAKNYSYDSDGQFLSGIKQGPVLGNTESIEEPSEDLLKKLWLAEADISEETAKKRLALQSPEPGASEIPDTSHLDYAAFLAKKIDDLPPGATFGEWQEDPEGEGFYRELVGADGADLGMQWGSGSDPENIKIETSTIEYPANSGELVSVSWSAADPDIRMLRISWPDGEFEGVKSLVFDAAGRQTGYLVLFDDGRLSGAHVQLNDDDSFMTSYIDAISFGDNLIGILQDATYDADGQFIEGVYEFGDDEVPLEAAPEPDVLRELWLEGKDISDRAVEPHLTRPLPVPGTISGVGLNPGADLNLDTSHIDLRKYLDVDVENLPPPLQLGTWQDQGNGTYRSEVFDEEDEVVGFVIGRGEKEEALEITDYRFTFEIETGEAITLGKVNYEDVLSIEISWPEKAPGSMKAFAFDDSGRQVGFGNISANGAGVAFYVEANEDGSFTTMYGEGKRTLAASSYESWHYTYDKDGNFLEGRKEGPEDGKVEMLDEEPESNRLKDLWLAGEDITEEAVDLR